MRYYAGLRPDWRLTFGSRTFEIVSVINPSERRKELELMLKELVVA
jgi:head-tail adaptor